MALDSRFTGREEKRLPVVMEVKLTALASASDRRETARVDNISDHGARVYATGYWQLGEQVEVTTGLEGTPMLGQVVYCQKLGNRFVVGLKFRRTSLWWSILQRLKGLIR